jgi:transposase InsO family protein
MMAAVHELKGQIGIKAACQALGVPRSGYYRQRQAGSEQVSKPRPIPARALSAAERQQIRAILNSPRFVDLAPPEIYATLLDEGRYLCSLRSMYRVLAEHNEVRERRNQLRRPAYRKPELLATGPNQVWSWDITRLFGPLKWSYFYLYVILDIYSRYVVGWMVALQEAAHLAEELIAETLRRQGIGPGQLTIHADNGRPMVAKPLAFLLAELGVTKSHSRPYQSNDNPFSEAQFRTMKYHPAYPQRFDDLLDAREWGQLFFPWYNHEHHHSALGLLTPADVHFGRAPQILAQRQVTLLQAYQQHPERFVKGQPVPAQLPEAVWINPPKPEPA